jgi:hypothetical protein
MIDPTDHPPDDPRDPLAAAFADYQPAPRDVVSRKPRSIADDLTDLAALAGAMVELAYYEVTPTGVTRRTERITITEPIAAEKE